MLQQFQQQISIPRIITPNLAHTLPLGCSSPNITKKGIFLTSSDSRAASPFRVTISVIEMPSSDECNPRNRCNQITAWPLADRDHHPCDFGSRQLCT